MSLIITPLMTRMRIHVPAPPTPSEYAEFATENPYGNIAQYDDEEELKGKEEDGSFLAINVSDENHTNDNNNDEDIAGWQKPDAYISVVNRIF